MPRNLYEILGVARDATPEDIKGAFRRRAKETHPDHGGDGDKFRDVTMAYEVLSDPQRRHNYDTTGDASGDRGQSDRTDALSILESIMGAVIGAYENGTNSFGRNVVDDIAEALTNKNREITGEIDKMRRAIVRLSKFAAKFSAKEGDNYLGRMVEFRITNIERNVVGAERMVRLHTIALDILKDQTFEPDPDPSKLQVEINRPGGIGATFIPMFHR